MSGMISSLEAARETMQFEYRMEAPYLSSLIGTPLESMARKYAEGLVVWVRPWSERVEILLPNCTCVKFFLIAGISRAEVIRRMKRAGSNIARYDNRDIAICLCYGRPIE